jgi:predicted Fe-Mo cluster-binding NifX family protein
MKICLPIMGESNLKKELLANDFYKAQYYCIYDMDKDSSEVFAINDSNSIYLSMTEIKKLEIGAIITPNLRPMAAKILFENEIEVYKASASLVEENISLFKRNLLNDFTQAMIENASSCSSGSCSSCSSAGSCN